VSICRATHPGPQVTDEEANRLLKTTARSSELPSSRTSILRSPISSSFDDEQLHDLLRAGSSGLRRRRLGRIVPLNTAVGQGFLQGGDSGRGDFGAGDTKNFQILAIL
jgi:hypothetical protein